MRGVFGHTRVVTINIDVPASGLFFFFLHICVVFLDVGVCV